MSYTHVFAPLNSPSSLNTGSCSVFQEENKVLQVETEKLRSVVSQPKEDHSGCKEKLAELEHKLQLLVEYPDLNPSPEKPEKLRKSPGFVFVVWKECKFLSECRQTVRPHKYR
ncbi:unnamed protein product [Dibothriocephalus latus]|uniref:Uncharacterized protein n=1 Tax=Dibothriocephalus latus TaxID=60516 RepID=A0A3P6PBV3_DIBLA|nr:unnamed protein product [Dibothriocephalus latus]